MNQNNQEPIQPAKKSVEELEQNLVDRTLDLRSRLRQIVIEQRNLVDHELFHSGAPERLAGQNGEMRANIMLAVRKMEEARFRSGMVAEIMTHAREHFKGGESKADTESGED